MRSSRELKIYYLYHNAIFNFKDDEGNSKVVELEEEEENDEEQDQEDLADTKTTKTHNKEEMKQKVAARSFLSFLL